MIQVLFPLLVSGPGDYFDNRRAAPYDMPVFRPVLDSSKLQCPKSSGGYCFVPYGQFEGVSNEHFYLVGRWMTFEMCGNRLRSELRYRGEFFVEEEAVLHARVLPVPLSAPEFTFLQLYGKDMGKPLLRLVWKGYRYGIHSHIWAVLRQYHEEGDSLSVEWVDLGEFRGAFDVMLKLHRGTLLIRANGRAVSRDVGRWKGRLYFKAGVYIQGEGCARTHFEHLDITF